MLNIEYQRLCNCPKTHLNCLTPKTWAAWQIGVWKFAYEKRDIRDKTQHPAAYPIALARRVIELFTHVGELVLDPFAGSGTTLVAARDCNRNAVGCELHQKYVELCNKRLAENSLFNSTQQIIVNDDARNTPKYIQPGTVSLICTSPPYANLLSISRKNKSRRHRHNDQYGKIEQYSQNPLDLGTLQPADYYTEMGKIFKILHPLLKSGGNCIINVVDFWQNGQREKIHIGLIQALENNGYLFKNMIIWDRTNIVNNIGIFGWPSNYITMGTSFEYILHFIKTNEQK